MDRNLRNTLAKNVAEQRRRSGWTQRELANRARVSRATVNRAEKGRLRSLQAVPLIAAALGVDVATLLSTPKAA